MAKTVVGLFDSMDEGRQVVRELIDAGFRSDDISLIAKHDGETITERGEDRTSGAAVGAGAGAAVGGLGGLLVGLAALAIPGVGPVIAAGPLATTLAGAGVGAAAGGILGALTDMGVPEDEAQYYAEGVRRGGALVSVYADDDRAQRAADIMTRYGAVDVDERAGQWRQSGWTRFDPNAEPYRPADRAATTERRTPTYAAAESRPSQEPPRREPDLAGTSRSTAAETRHTPVQTERNITSTSRAGEEHRRVDEGEVRVPVVEEETQIGKRQVARGGVRLYTRVTERPVEETVRLRDETVHVERRPVDRPASERDITGFKEGTIEVTETDEEAVVNKRARVVEEVVVSKDVAERTETVRGTERHTEVEVEPIRSERTTTPGGRGFETYDTDFRSHYTSTLANRGHGYERWSPGYRYGYELASDPNYSGKEWTVVEPEARRRWEERHRGHGTWEEFKETVRYGWDKVRGRR